MTEMLILDSFTYTAEMEQMSPDIFWAVTRNNSSVRGPESTLRSRAIESVEGDMESEC